MKSRFSNLIEAVFVGKHGGKAHRSIGENNNIITAQDWTPHNIKQIVITDDSIGFKYYMPSLSLKENGSSVAYPSNVNATMTAEKDKTFIPVGQYAVIAEDIKTAQPNGAVNFGQAVQSHKQLKAVDLKTVTKAQNVVESTDKLLLVGTRGGERSIATMLPNLREIVIFYNSRTPQTINKPTVNNAIPVIVNSNDPKAIMTVLGGSELYKYYAEGKHILLPLSVVLVDTEKTGKTREQFLQIMADKIEQEAKRRNSVILSASEKIKSAGNYPLYAIPTASNLGISWKARYELSAQEAADKQNNKVFCCGDTSALQKLKDSLTFTDVLKKQENTPMTDIPGVYVFDMFKSSKENVTEQAFVVNDNYDTALEQKLKAYVNDRQLKAIAAYTFAKVELGDTQPETETDDSDFDWNKIKLAVGTCGFGVAAENGKIDARAVMQQDSIAMLPMLKNIFNAMNIDNSGNTNIPQFIYRYLASVMCKHNGKPETIARNIPISANSVNFLYVYLCDFAQEKVLLDILANYKRTNRVTDPYSVLPKALVTALKTDKHYLYNSIGKRLNNWGLSEIARQMGIMNSNIANVDYAIIPDIVLYSIFTDLIYSLYLTIAFVYLTRTGFGYGLEKAIAQDKLTDVLKSNSTYIFDICKKVDIVAPSKFLSELTLKLYNVMLQVGDKVLPDNVKAFRIDESPYCKFIKHTLNKSGVAIFDDSVQKHTKTFAELFTYCDFYMIEATFANYGLLLVPITVQGTFNINVKSKEANTSILKEKVSNIIDKVKEETQIKELNVDYYTLSYIETPNVTDTYFVIVDAVLKYKVAIAISLDTQTEAIKNELRQSLYSLTRPNTFVLNEDSNTIVFDFATKETKYFKWGFNK